MKAAMGCGGDALGLLPAFPQMFSSSSRSMAAISARSLSGVAWRGASTLACFGHAPAPHPIGAGIFAADGAGHHHLGLGGGGGGFHNAASASPAPFFPAYSLDAAGGGGIAPIDDAGAARSVLEDEMCLGPGSAAWAGAGVGGSDRRKKRMIKNRESAARSRARKQAYVRELEKEVQLLQQELESVRAKYEELRVSVEVPVPVRKTLQRMPSAPF